MRKQTVAVWILTGLSFALAGCSREETVKIVNDFDEPIRVSLNGSELIKTVIPTHGSVVLDDKFYIGRMNVGVYSLQNVLLKQEEITPPGDSAFRSMAVLEVKP